MQLHGEACHNGGKCQIGRSPQWASVHERSYSYENPMKTLSAKSESSKLGVQKITVDSKDANALVKKVMV